MSDVYPNNKLDNPERVAMQGASEDKNLEVQPTKPKTNFSSCLGIEVRDVDVAEVALNPYQPRRAFDEEELDELALSIKAVGLIHPPVVRLRSGQPAYELISGERRFRAVQRAGLTKIPVIVRTSGPSHSAEAALIENIQRVDLNPLEIGASLGRLMTEFGFTQEELALRVGKKRSTIANYLRLLSLPKPIQESLRGEQITMGHAKAILSLEIDQQLLLHEMIVRDRLNVRQAEVSAQKMQEAKKPLQPRLRDVHLAHLAEQLQKKLGTKVAIKGNKGKGRLLIDYFSLDDLERILIALGWEE
jgi:ParB family transcriptional regulator, chromosome partitioning protein